MNNAEKTCKVTFLLIIGESGSGKTEIEKYLVSTGKAVNLVSHTTRPIRVGEIENVNHIFDLGFNVNKKNIFAYTKFGGHDYWTTIGDVIKLAKKKLPIIYVIDEDGYKSIKNHFPLSNKYTLRIIRENKNVSKDRLDRDKNKFNMPLYAFDFILENNGTLEEAFNKADKIINKINYYENT